jgi:antitoxin (DNA-binding transcriptional repressor) of toxin-antitoxin stability system
MKVSAQYAASHFDDLLSAASNGEEVEIAGPNNPVFKLVVVNPPAHRSRNDETEGQLHEEIAWIAANRATFVGRWVALSGAKLLAVGDSAREVSQATAQANPRPLIHRVREELLPFAGW